MFYPIFILLFFFNSVVKSYDAIINLGGDCQVMYQMKIHGLREYALPFDLLITPFKSLQGMLENDFDGFITPENFDFVVSEAGEKYILDKKYGSRWIHDFGLQEDFLKDYDDVAAKYVRRIERLRHLIHDTEYPIFIRKTITKDQAIELRNILSTVRAGRPFLLVALHGTQEMEVDWQLHGIRNYYLRQPDPYVWKGDPQAWKEIFCDVGLEVSDAVCTN